ncbi:MAG TPA: 4-(cytidine 5'-diphospho)-2-C-methyl-D-erythritol kinase [Gemmatimonadales bacterium]|nr:4-(cytidine 5'-diphospho)-2-C-methyl-D-erythritol kinase [Gemmatimonadales bacterium]
MPDTPLRRKAFAKANLFLRVLAREASGYHDIETLFCLLDLADVLTAERREGQTVTIEVRGADVGPAADNLAVRAAEMVLQATGRRFGIHLTLEKRIPVQAGLGGGSSDAAAALVLANQLAGNAVPRHELLQFGARLGSDVPFFVSEARLALAWGRGERMIRLPPLPAAPGLLLVPAEGMPTAEAYGWIDAGGDANRRGGLSLDLEVLRSWGDIARMSGNDFEAALFAKRPALKAAFEALAGTHPLLCRLTGSGSAFLAVYRTPKDREDAAMMLGRKHGKLLEVTAGG